MRNRKAFTLIELLVVIGIIVLLIGILLPVLTRVRRSAQITQQKADFQTISTALENYHNDFLDYPRNLRLTSWNTQNPPQGLAAPWPAPVTLTLAAALLGPSPGVTQLTSSNIYEVGDGADGFGERTATVNIPVTILAPSFIGNPASVTVTASSGYGNQFNAFISTFVKGQTVASLTLSAGTAYEETVGVLYLTNVAGSSATFNVSQPVYTSASPQHQASPTDTYILKVATGKVWGPYISADTFKVAYLPQFDYTGTNALPNFEYGQPVLLDRWGQVIQYFPRYGPASNRTNDSADYAAVNTSIIAGPLCGYSQPKSVDPIGENAIWDFRDGTPFFNSTSQGSSTPIVQQWVSTTTSPPPSNPNPNFNPVQAMLWMLGDNNTANGAKTLFNNAITGSDTLNFSGPYILISAGPDGPYRFNGGFCNLLDSTGNLIGDGAVAKTQWLQTFTASGNIYNFDHP